MPRGDRTGPNGMGSMTGKGAGFCAVNQRPEYGNTIPGRGNGFGAGRGAGFGFGRGIGRGWRNWFGGFFAPAATPVPPPVEMSPEKEKQMLASQLGELQKQLAAVSQRLSDLEDK